MLPFAEGMLALAIVMGSIALAAVRFHWHIESGKPLIIGSFCAGFLVLIASASYQLGTNLPVLQQMDAPAGEIVTDILPGDGLATLYMGHLDPQKRYNEFWTRSLSISNPSLELGPPTILRRLRADFSNVYFAVSERDPSVWYRVGAGKEDDNSGAQLEIYHQVGSSLEWPEPTRIALWSAEGKGRWAPGYPYELHDRLYIVGYRSIVFDISDPLHPRRLIDQPIQEWRPPRGPLTSNNPVIQLPPAPGIPSLERLKWELRLAGKGPFDGKTWCRPGFEENEPSNFDFVVLRLKSLSDDQAEFETITQYKQTLIQRLANGQRLRPIQLQNGMLYAAGERGVLDVFDVSGDGPAKLTAHFAAPGLNTFALLPDGRVIAGGSKIWVLGAAKH